MRKFQKAAVVMAALGTVTFLGAGVSQAGDGPALEVDSKQSNTCGNESQSGVLNIGRINVQILDILANQPVDQSKSVTCTNAFALGGGH
ncbi:hypothetical protein [Streptomyces coeruleorubidus]|uniref:DUF320 domain-containing protein n=1 Tax=Streptomyces coeruleorubidus TaxID=116188 RepID=A0A5J6I1V9_STRC4|nr:hypothetical protein [Streptomyces coeruleorubidus]QEV25462.1 hypothetical protein CP976_15745 [Streptomyces coeruleorubidus]GGT50526.1 hypothetical protein GCM10010256_03680 [Streptomyces coeruleorubidus]